MVVISTLVAAESSGGISAIGLDPKALLFQLINFAILFWVLKKVAYKPILRVLEARRLRIEESLKTAREIEQKEKRLAEQQAQVLRAAREEAGDIVAKARMQTTEMVGAAETKARVQADKLLADAKSRIEQEVEAARVGLKHELAGLVVSATEVVLEEKVDAPKDKQLIERALQEASR